VHGTAEACRLRTAAADVAAPSRVGPAARPGSECSLKTCRRSRSPGTSDEGALSEVGLPRKGPRSPGALRGEADALAADIRRLTSAVGVADAIK